MCTPKNIKLVLMLMNLFKSLAAAMFVWYGIDLAFTWDYQWAYSLEMESLGLGMMVTGLIYPFSTACAYYGSRAHNKFLLTLHAFIDYGLFATQLTFINRIRAYTVSDISASDRNDCMSITPRYEGGYPDICNTYYFSERYAKFHLAWVGKFHQAMVDPEQYTALMIEQISGSCCGYGLPGTCIENENPYPSDLLMTSIPPEWQTQVTRCNAEVCVGENCYDWYVMSGTGAMECDHYIDLSVADPILGGCEYEMPIGECMNSDPATIGFDFRGCAATYEDSINLVVAGYASSFMSAALLAFISATFACCHCWKRKETDILPNYIIDIPWDPDDPKNYKVKEKEMDEFDIEDAEEERKEAAQADMDED